MTDFTPGAIITRESPLWDGERPSWLRYGTMFKGGFGTRCEWTASAVVVDPAISWASCTAIRLDASDIVYQCIAWNEAHPDEAPFFPHYGGDKMVDDWDFGAVLLSCGHEWRAGIGNPPCCSDTFTIGYRKRRPTTSLPEPAEEEAAVHSRAYLEAECERAGTVAVPKMTESELNALCADWIGGDDDMPAMSLAAYLAKRLGFLVSPLDLAKAAHPNISPEIVESIAAIVTKGEA